VLLVGWLVAWPILIAFFQTIHVNTPDGPQWSIKSYRFFFSDSYSLGNLWLTLWTTALTGALLILLSLPIALYLRYTETRLAAFVQSLAVFPLFVPSIILAYALIRAVGPNGTLDTVLNALQSSPGPQAAMMNAPGASPVIVQERVYAPPPYYGPYWGPPPAYFGYRYGRPYGRPRPGYSFGVSF